MLKVESPSLAQRTTLRLGGHALVELWPETVDDLAMLPEVAREYGAPVYPLGRGSNLLARDGEIPLVLLRLDKIAELGIAAEENDRIIVHAGAGTPLRKLLRFCLAQGLSGLEGLVGIPGNVGGAVAMNAGSFGSVIGSCLKSITVLIDGSVREVAATELELGYRSLSIKGCSGLPLVTGANLALTRACKSVIFRSMSLNFNEKKSRQPLTSWSAGCAFRNIPGELPTGKLLEEAGFRGRRLGGMIFSPRHANFLVNEGHGVASEALELLALARDAVRRRHGLELELELRVAPCPWP